MIKTVKELQAEQKKLHKARKVLCKQRDELDNQIKDLYHQIQELRTQELKETLFPLTIEKILALNWETIPYPEPYSQIDKFFWDNYRLKGLKFDGYYRETGQVGVKLGLDNKRPVKEQMGLLEILPHIKPLKDGFLHIGIFEHTLSEHGIFHLKGKEGDVRLLKTTYGQERELQTFTSWEEAIKYVHKNHPHN